MPATACEVDGRMIEGARPSSTSDLAAEDRGDAPRETGSPRREPCTRIASAIAIAYAMTSSDPQPDA